MNKVLLCAIGISFSVLAVANEEPIKDQEYIQQTSYEKLKKKYNNVDGEGELYSEINREFLFFILYYASGCADFSAIEKEKYRKQAQLLAQELKRNPKFERETDDWQKICIEDALYSESSQAPIFVEQSNQIYKNIEKLHEKWRKLNYMSNIVKDKQDYERSNELWIPEKITYRITKKSANGEFYHIRSEEVDII